MTEDIQQPQSEAREDQQPTESVPSSQQPQSQDDDNAERSRLGRKVKMLEEQMKSLLNTTESMKALVEQMLQSSSPSRTVHEDTEKLDEDIDWDAPIVTFKDAYERFKKVQQLESKKVQTKAQQYAKVYMQNLNAFLLSEPEQTRDELYHIWKTKYDKLPSDIHSADPVRDAELAYLRAKLDYLATKKTSLRNETPQVPTGTSTYTKPRSVSISDEAMSLAKYLGWDENKLSEIFSDERR